MDWTDENVEKLRQLWSEGLSANEIAKKLGVTKNAIVGKVHRLCLKARPSPIKSKDNTENVKETSVVVEVEEQTLTVEQSVVEETEIVEEAPVYVEKKIYKRSPSNVKLMELDSHTCRWPIGDPRDEDFCFCGKRVRSGQTYCDEHSAVAYVKALKK